MIIHLNNSRLFTVSPDIRFASENGVDVGVWAEIWRRYKLLEYTVPELMEYVHIRTGNRPSRKSVNRWIFRAEIYMMAKFALENGATTVVSSFFNEYEKEVIQEITKHMRSGGKKSSRSLA